MEIVTTINELEAVLGKEKLKDIAKATCKASLLTRAKENGQFVMEPFWDYHDVISFGKTVSRLAAETDFSNCKNSEEVFWKLESSVFEDAEWAYEDEQHLYISLVDEIIDSITEDELEVDISLEDWIDYLENEIGVVYESGINENLMGCSFKVDIVLDSGKEINTDNTLIPSCFQLIGEAAEGKLSREELDERKSLFDNAFSWILLQNGFTWSDIVSENPKAISFLNELYECTSWMANLTLLATVSIDIFCKLVAKEGNFEVDVKDPYFSLGLFDYATGSGSVLGIKPEANFILPASLVQRVIVEGERNQGLSTVDEVYGLIADCWPECLKVTDEKGDLSCKMSDDEWDEFCNFVTKEPLQKIA